MMEEERWECKITFKDNVCVDFNKVPIPISKLIRITSKRDKNISIVVKVSGHSKDLRSAGVSLSQSISKIFDFHSNEEVVLEMVSEENCKLSLLEVRFVDQYVSRGDMYRLKMELIGSCIYIKKLIDFSAIVVDVASMYDTKGVEVKSGFISSDTHVVFRSLSAFTQLFIQIGKEMWDADDVGTFNFEKVVYQFINELFDQWASAKANHDIQIIYFMRVFFTKGTVDQLDIEEQEMIQYDKQDEPYMDFYDVICDGGNLTDCKSIMGDLKRRFKELTMCHARTQLMNEYDAEVSSSARGNFLEMINLSLDQHSAHFSDRVHYRTGQQIVIVTAGCGVFNVDKTLVSFTKHRVLDLGVGVDVVCLGSKPLHATPLFVSDIEDKSKMLDKLRVPHWINLHFYISYRSSNRERFIPMTGVGAYCKEIKPLEVFHDTFPLGEPDELENFTSKKLGELCDEYDDNLLKQEKRTDSLPDMFIPGIMYASTPPTPPHHISNSCSSEDTGFPLDRGNMANSSTLDRRGTPLSALNLNPFWPSDIPRPITNSRRRWAHAFPPNTNPSQSWNGLSRSLRVEQDKIAEMIDWQSLVAPACFPISTDFDLQERGKMASSNFYSEYPHTVVTEKPTEALKELVCQRLSRGFQIIDISKPADVARKFSTLQNNKSLSRRGLGSIAENKKYLLSWGDIYHSLEKTTESQISVKIHKPKKKSEIPPIAKEYRYGLRPYLGTQRIHCKTSFAAREKMIDLKWNNFDQYITNNDANEEINTEVEDMKSLKPWSSRYVILPRADTYFPDEDVLSDSLDDPAIINNFYNILFLMNNLKGQDIIHEKRKGLDLPLNIPTTSSNSASLPSSPIHNCQPSFSSEENTSSTEKCSDKTRTFTPQDFNKLNMSSLPTTESGFPSDNEPKPTPSLPCGLEKTGQPSPSFLSKLFPKTGTNTSQPLKNLIEQMTNPECGNQMSFLKIPKKGQINQITLPEHTFLSSLLVDWLYKQLDDVETREKAIDIAQQMLKKNLIERVDKQYDRAIDKSGVQIFFDGFYLYNIASKANKNKTKQSIHFEIAVPWGTNHVSRIDDFRPDGDVLVEIAGHQKEKDRDERFNVCHHTCFDPRHAFELIVDWEVATGKLIEENYLLKWKEKAKKSGFNFVSVPQSPFTGPRRLGVNKNGDNDHIGTPFRAFIEVSIECSDLGEIEKAIQNFGFLRDFPAGRLDNGKGKNNNFVHHTGFCFAQINLGVDISTIKWAFNPLLGSKKWQPFLPDGNSKDSKDSKESLKFSQHLLDKFMKHIKCIFTIVDSD